MTDPSDLIGTLSDALNAYTDSQQAAKELAAELAAPATDQAVTPDVPQTPGV